MHSTVCAVPGYTMYVYHGTVPCGPVPCTMFLLFYHDSFYTPRHDRTILHYRTIAPSHYRVVKILGECLFEYCMRVCVYSSATVRTVHSTERGGGKRRYFFPLNTLNTVAIISILSEMIRIGLGLKLVDFEQSQRFIAAPKLGLGGGRI